MSIYIDRSGKNDVLMSFDFDLYLNRAYSVQDDFFYFLIVL